MFDDEHSFLSNLLRRGLYSSPFLLISLGLFSKAISGGNPLFVFTLVCYSALFFLIGAIIFVPVFTGLFADSLVGALFTPHGNRPHLPAYSGAEAMVKRQEYRAALKTYRAIADDFPDELHPWLEMIAIAVRYLHDDEAAFAYYQEAREKFPSPEDRGRLLENYKALKSLTADKPDWLQPRTIGLAGATAADGAGQRERRKTKKNKPEDTGDSQRRRIQYRIFDGDQPPPPPSGVLKATDDSPPKKLGNDDPGASTRRVKLAFNPQEIASKMESRNRREAERTTSPQSKPSATPAERKKIPFNPARRDG